MIVDCDRCAVRGDACQECVVTVLLGAPPGAIDLDSTETTAFENLAAAGMVPRLQLVNREKFHPGCGAAEHEPGDGAKRSFTSDERCMRDVG